MLFLLGDAVVTAVRERVTLPYSLSHPHAHIALMQLLALVYSLSLS